MKLTFLGAVGTVTGSKYLLEIDKKKVLIDCGLFQGVRELRRRNWNPLPIKPETLDLVVLTHAHIDHSGYLPLLVKNGFTGPIYCTQATAELCSILLPDSGYLQEEEAKRANKYGYSRHHPARPLYTREDALQCLKQFKSLDYHTPHALLPQIEFSWHRAGHILGAAFIKIKHQNRVICFSGDLGRTNDVLMKPKDNLKHADYLILESTYGNRLHDPSDPNDAIETLVNNTIHRGGTVLIPAFAVGRSQHMLYYIQQLKQAQRIPDVPVFLDSPMAIDATQAMLHHQHEQRLTPDLCKQVCQIAQYIQTPDESIALTEDQAPKIIISASGMLTGGRVLHHLKHLAPDSRNSLLLTGFQAPGTRGDSILNQEKNIKIYGELIPINAEVIALSHLSAHADYEEILSWLKHIQTPPKTVFITHGTPASSSALKSYIESELGWHCVIPAYLDHVKLK
ncbi:MAG: MBL fold metallo-hydrolase [Legionellaceae bacterium]|nr:MBL fold metallo-hydrolase [Legionellaceae bacterium]